MRILGRSFKITLVVLPLSLASAVLGSGGDSRTPRDVSKIVQELRAWDKSPTADRDRQKELLFDLAAAGGKEAMSVLKEYYHMADRNPSNSLRGLAQMAFARAGDAAAYEDILQELHSGDTSKEIDAFYKLGQVGTREAVRQLASYLDDSSVPVMSRPLRHDAPTGMIEQDSVLVFARQYYAAKALADAVQDAPTRVDPELYMEEDLKAWQEWWVGHEKDYK